MKSATVFSLMTAFALSLGAADTPLPAPWKTGGISLAEALNMRRTTRQYKADMPGLQQISQLFWSAFGACSFLQEH